MIFTQLQQLDVSLFYAINHLPHLMLTDKMAAFIHYATRGGLIYLPLLLLFVSKNLRKLFWTLLSSAGVTVLLADIILKPFINRPRPFEALANVITVLPKPQNASFPSSQTATAAAIVMACVLLLPGRWKYLLWIWVLIVGLDRIYMGHHYPSDVLVGAILGILVAAVINILITRLNKSSPEQARGTNKTINSSN